uniref:Uncharacterized protein n=1 Tax=Pithovirus LCPAC404 TaxID=2506597 RepID=A0A481ZDK9_9VIRU|nr:MAG: uncharacterized protein LCPAC404_02690 [Pithovirus LCPAC404]
MDVHPRSPIDNTQVFIEGKEFDTNELTSIKLASRRDTITRSADHRSMPGQSINAKVISSKSMTNQTARNRMVSCSFGSNSDRRYNVRSESIRNKRGHNNQFLPLSNNDKVRKRTRSAGTSAIQVQTTILHSAKSNRQYNSHRQLSSGIFRNKSYVSNKVEPSQMSYVSRSAISTQMNYVDKPLTSKRGSYINHSASSRRESYASQRPLHRPSHRPSQSRVSYASHGLVSSSDGSLEIYKSPKSTKAIRRLRKLLDSIDDKDIPDYSLVTDDESEQIRDKFRSYFSTLRENYSELDVPAITADESLKKIHIRYNDYLKQIHVASSSSDYFLGLIVAFLFVEYCGSQLLGLNFTNFTKHHLSRIGKYKRVLIKLGEDNYDSEDTDASPLVQLLFFLILDAIVFLVLGLFADRIDDDLRNTIEKAVGWFVSGNKDKTKPIDGNGVELPPSSNGGSGDGIGGMIQGLLSSFLGGGTTASNVNVPPFSE